MFAIGKTYDVWINIEEGFVCIQDIKSIIHISVLSILVRQ